MPTKRCNQYIGSLCIDAVGGLEPLKYKNRINAILPHEFLFHASFLILKKDPELMLTISRHRVAGTLNESRLAMLVALTTVYIANNNLFKAELKALHISVRSVISNISEI